MEIYQITYQEYVALMTRVKNEIDMIINITPDNTRKMMAIRIAVAIERTIATAQAEINLPSAELQSIVNAIIDLKTCGATPIPDVMDALNRCFNLLSLATDVLLRITDDSYVTSAKEKLKEIA